jgi:outer membrane protein assembly factor BamE (lipoprotein component of BamABCDE complex)
MRLWLRLLTVALLLTASACVSAGNRAITDTDVVSQIAVGKSTQAEVTALLGYPLTASYGGQGTVTWHYALVTMAPQPGAFVPLVKAYAPDLRQTTRELFVTFTPKGTVKSLEQARPPQGPGPAG